MKKIARYFFKKNDLIIYFIILIVTFLPFALFKSDNSKVSKNDIFAEISFEGKTTLYSLNQDKIIKLKNGLIIIEIKEKKVRVKQSDCKDKICVKKGWIDKKGQFIICMPNKLVIKIVGKDNYDSISY